MTPDEPKPEAPAEPTAQPSPEVMPSAAPTATPETPPEQATEVGQAPPANASNAPVAPSAASEVVKETPAETPSGTPVVESVLPPAGAPMPPPPPPALPPQPVPQVAAAPTPQDLSRIAQDLQLRKAQVESVVQLLDDQNTVPFITRYRKERTGGLDETQIRRVQSRVEFLREVAAKKQTILRSVANQGKLTDGFVEAVMNAEQTKRLDDLYLPFKAKKKSLASEAKEKGLEPLALAIWGRDPAIEPLPEFLAGMVDPWKQLHDVNDVTTGVKNILAELVSEQSEVRGSARAFLWDTAEFVATRIETVPEGKGAEYRDYSKFKEACRVIPPHRVLAINRGERENILRVRIDSNRDELKNIARFRLGLDGHPHQAFIESVVPDSVDRMLLPSLEREIRRELTEHAQDHAVDIFARNLGSLLMRPPLGGRRVLAIDPGIRTGCKVAVLDETGTMLEDAVVYPHPPRKDAAGAKRKLEQLIRKYQTSVIAIGNGTACRETEQLVSDLIAELEERRLNPPPAASPIPQGAVSTPTVAAPVMAEPEAPVAEPMPAATTESTDTSGVAETTSTMPGVNLGETVSTSTAGEATTAMTPTAPAPAPEPAAPPVSLDGLDPAPADLAYVIVNEAGASDYSASPTAKEEFPDLDATTRGTISIGRRLQDPLAELVKVDPQHVGVGLYQHDVRAKYLKLSVESVIESCVNSVGVDVNTASVPLLRHVSGLNQLVARQVVEYRAANGPFKSRDQLRSVPQLGDIRFTQAAGFLKIPGGDEPFDTTAVHPESYELARKVLTEFGFAPADLHDREKLKDLREKLNTITPEEMATKLEAGGPTVRDIYHAVARPGRDPREDRPEPIFRKGVLKLEDLAPGMELRGEVLNVVDFGAFVDVGLKDSGLVHISQMANRYIKSPYDVVSVGDVVTVWVMEVKPGEKKISLSMLQPGQERRPPERGGQDRGGPPREQREPRGDRPREQRPAVPPPQQDQRDRPPQPARDDRGGNRGGPPQRDTRGGFQPRQGQGAASRFNNRGPGQGGPPPRPNAPPAAAQPPAPVVPPPPPKPPGKPKPLPNLSSEKKTGKAPLNTFGELLAFFKPPEPEKKPEPPKEEPKKEEAKAEEPKAEEPKPEGQS